ncbi:MAG: prolipoprotein diacylglyceryl transferase, partial [Clostridia bacterium]|nr:prolipoprotein diacylglyceryl transferase [Clostridia bacterium]
MTNTIGFPKLGLEFEINRIAFTVFGKSVYWYAVIILTGFLLGVLFVYKTCKKRGIEPDHIFDIGFYGLIAGIICARIYYVIFDPDCLDGSILNVIKIWEGGLAIYGGIIGAFLSTFIYCKIKKIPLLKTVDVCAPGLFIGQAIGRWGN